MKLTLLLLIFTPLGQPFPVRKANKAVSRKWTTNKGSMNMNGILSITVGVSPVRTGRELEDASEFFVRTFWPDSVNSLSAQKQLEGDQLNDWCRRYDPTEAAGRQGTLLVAKEFGRIVGVASVAATPYGQLGSGKVPSSLNFDPRAAKESRDIFVSKARPRGDKCPVLANLSVNPKARRRGIASKLAAKAESVAKSWGYEEIALAVEETNEPAKRLYRKRGYLDLYSNVVSTKIQVEGERIRTAKTANAVMIKEL